LNINAQKLQSFLIIRILTDSDRKRNRKEVLAYYKTRINIDHHHDRWIHGIEGSQSSYTVIHYKA
jgi:hypothetical protein